MKRGNILRSSEAQTEPVRECGKKLTKDKNYFGNNRHNGIEGLKITTVTNRQ